MARLIRHEKPLQTNEHGKNPNKITINQHVIPNKHLLEWSSDGKMVEVFDIESKKSKYLPAKSSYFCVMRLWDQWTESKMLKINEDNYQSQIELMKNGGDFTNLNYVIEYYVLLCVRVRVANKERPHYPSVFSSISHECNQSELEDNELEMDGTVHIIDVTIDSNSQHMAREVVKIVMNQTFVQWYKNIEGQKWHLYQSDNDSFILSDAFCTNFLDGFHVLPLNPKQVLIADSTYKALVNDSCLSAQYINDVMKRNAINYYVELSNSDDKVS